MRGILGRYPIRAARRPGGRAAAGLLALAIVAGAAQTAVAMAPAGATPRAAHSSSRVIHPSGRVHAKAARVVNFGKLARAWQARHGKHAARRAPGVVPQAAFTTAFNGISQSDCPTCQVGPEAVTSANGSQILEEDGTQAPGFVKVFDKSGTALCGGGMPLDAFLGRPGDPVHDPTLQYDNVSNQFLMLAADGAVAGPGANSVLIASTTAHDACGTWRISTLSLPAGHELEFLNSGGLDAHALVVSAEIAIGVPEYTDILAIPRADLYAGPPLSATVFTVLPQPITVSAAGSPPADAPGSYLLGAEAADVYDLYTLAGVGTAAPTLTLQDIVTPPNLGIVQPTFDGSRIWFIEPQVQQQGGTGFGYGYISLATGSVTLATISGGGSGNYADGSSIAVSPDADGTVSVFLAWTAGTVSNGQVQGSDFVKSFIYPGSGPLPGNAGSDQNVAVFDDTRRLDFSSAAIDPGAANGTCAVTAQPSGRGDGTWTTLVRRKCGLATAVPMPSVTGDTQAAAVSAVRAAGLAASVGSVTSRGGGCDATTQGTIFAQNPSAGTAVSIGATVSLSLCNLPVVPDVTGETPAQAAAGIQSAGLTAGSTGLATDCTVPVGRIIGTIPAAGTIVDPGATVGMIKSRGPGPDC